MKKIITACLSLLLMAGMAITVFAAGGVTFSMTPSSGTLHRGDTITLNVSVSSSESATSYGLMLDYDKSVFEEVAGSGSTSVQGALVNSYNNGFAFMFQNATAYSGSVGTVTLKVKDDAAFGDYTVTGTASVKNGTATVAANDCIVTFKVECDHAWEGEVTTEATCTTAGVKTYTCANNCGVTPKTETIKALGHKYDNGKVTTNATCTTTGVKTYTCTNGCGIPKTETIKALGHKYDNGKVTTKATCTTAGVKTYTCTNGCGTPKTETIKALGHKYDNGKVTTKATCTTAGVKTYTCTNGCGIPKTEAIAALGHKWDAGKITTAATCGKDGVKTFTCGGCMETKTAVIKATGKHDYSDSYKDNGEDGHTAYCACEASKNEKHSFTVQGNVIAEPTTSTEGQQEMLCVCGAKTLKTLPVLPVEGELDDVPQTGDITRNATMNMGAILAVAAIVIFAAGSIKRKEEE